jgi:hypothetical protein
MTFQRWSTLLSLFPHLERDNRNRSSAATMGRHQGNVGHVGQVGYAFFGDAAIVQ